MELLRFKFETPVEVFYAEFEKRTGCVDDLCDVLGHDDAVACLDAAITAAVRRAAEQGQREALKWAEKHHPIWVDRFDGEAGEVVQRETVEEYVTRGLAALADEGRGTK